MGHAAINPALRRSYDLRGQVGATLTEADAWGVGRAFAALARARGLATLAVSRDGRLSSEALEGALVQGLVEAGARVVRLPPGPTPVVSFAIERLGLDGGVMVTGSHNPPDQNGFKLMLGGDPLHGAPLEALWEQQGLAAGGGSVEEADLTEEYLQAVLAEAGETPVAAVWDCGNGVAGPIVGRLVERLPGSHRIIFGEVDGRFPNHHPDPSVPENLRDLADAVRTGGADLGIAFDGDGDRIGLVDGSGAIVWPDQMLLLLAQDVLRERPGAAVVADVKSSAVLLDGISAAGGRPVMGPSGYVLVRERMLAEDAPLAGEMSGHIFFRDRWHGSDDGIYVAMRVLGALSRRGGTLRDFHEVLPRTAATPEIRLPCPDDAKDAVIERVAARLDGSAQVDRTDGLRVSGPDGWWLVRASGTEAKVTVRCEAADEAALARLKAGLADALRAAGVDPGPLA